jgi:hypothetical protein
MSHAFKICIIVIGALLGIEDRALAQCFVCSDTNNNTAAGANALASNTGGVQNSAIGSQALYSNNVGVNNMALGYEALYANTTGSYNTAVGTYALVSATTATGNNAQGYSALFNTTTGSVNTAQGFQALLNNTTGSHNVGIGYQAGYYLTTGSYNIDIANFGLAGDSSTIRIGTQGTQTQAYVAGVSTAQITGSAVYVTSSGQLGVLSSSERYKTDVEPMGKNSEKLKQLRPVTFHLKTDPKGAVQYGLIAEEVNAIYPELVIRDDQGKIQGVRYDELAPMLLSEMQHERQETTAKLDAQAAEIRDLKKLVIEMQAGLLKLQTRNELVAQR